MSSKDYHLVVKRLLRTEKGAAQTEALNKYFFDVDPKANKLEIKRAIEQIYNVKVSRVNTQNISGKPKTVRYATGYTTDRKKAIVTLAAGQKIDLTI